MIFLVLRDFQSRSKSVKLNARRPLRCGLMLAAASARSRTATLLQTPVSVMIDLYEAVQSAPGKSVSLSVDILTFAIGRGAPVPCGERRATSTAQPLTLSSCCGGARPRSAPAATDPFGMGQHRNASPRLAAMMPSTLIELVAGGEDEGQSLGEEILLKRFITERFGRSCI